MHVITISGHDPGDYVHPDQKLQIIDEATGKKYELYLRSNVMSSAETGEISLFLPLGTIREIQSDEDYCVVTLSHPVSDKERADRKKRARIHIGIGPASLSAPKRAGPRGSKKWK